MVEQLRLRLIRRGVDLSSALAGGLPAVPARLVESVLRTSDGIISASVLSLSEGVLWSMSMHKVKLFALTLLTLALVGGAGLWASRPSASPDARSADEPNKGSAKAAEKKTEVKEPKEKATEEQEKKTALTAAQLQPSASRSPKRARRRGTTLPAGSACCAIVLPSVVIGL